MLETGILQSQHSRLICFLNVQFLKTARNSVWLSKLNVNSFDGTASNLYLRPITSPSKQSPQNIICSRGIFAIQCSAVMAVNSHHFACSCINQQTVNHPSVSRLADVRENHWGQFSFSLHSGTETISVPVYSHGFVFPHPHTEISPKCPEKKKKKDTEFILPGKLFLGIASETKHVCTFILCAAFTAMRQKWQGSRRTKSAAPAPHPAEPPAGARHRFNSIWGTLLFIWLLFYSNC